MGVHKLLKKACFEYLTIILEQISKKDNNVPRTDEYVTKIQNMLSKGIEDAHAPTRNQAFRGLAFLSFIDESRGYEKVHPNQENDRGERILIGKVRLSRFYSQSKQLSKLLNKCYVVLFI